MSTDRKLAPGDHVLLRVGPHIEKAGKDLTHVKWEKYPESKDRVMTQILCKVCGTVIGGQVETDAKAPSRIIRGTTYIYKMLSFSRFASYTEIEITFDDGSKHITHLCTGCLQKLHDPAMLEYVYVCDLAQWLHEEHKGYGQAIWHTYPECAYRKPVSWVDKGGLG